MVEEIIKSEYQGRLAILIPAYNELSRFNFMNLDKLFELSKWRTQIYIIDDGSKDGFAEKAKIYSEKNSRFKTCVVKLNQNLGKAEALRVGCNLAIDAGFDILAIADADFSSPPEDILKLVSILEFQNLDIVIGSRMKTGSNDIQGNIFRFSTGRLFSFLVQILFHLNIYDTQCGFKVFRNSNELRKAMNQKIIDPWLFDISILIRMKKYKQKVNYLEIPLQNWVHKEGSKINILQMCRSAILLFKLRFKEG